MKYAQYMQWQYDTLFEFCFKHEKSQFVFQFHK